MAAIKFTFDTHFESGAARAAAEKRSRKSYSADELEALTAASYEQGLNSGDVMAQQAVAEALGRMSAVVLQAIEAMDAEIETIRGEAARVAFACARKLAGAALASAPEAEIAETLRLALHEAIAEPRIVVKTPPALAEEIKRRAAEIAHEEGYEGRIQFAPDPTLTGADCRIEWKGGGIENSLTAIDNTLIELIQRRFPRTGSLTKE